MNRRHPSPSRGRCCLPRWATSCRRPPPVRGCSNSRMALGSCGLLASSFPPPLTATPHCAAAGIDCGPASGRRPARSRLRAAGCNGANRRARDKRRRNIPATVSCWRGSCCDPAPPGRPGACTPRTMTRRGWRWRRQTGLVAAFRRGPVRGLALLALLLLGALALGCGALPRIGRKLVGEALLGSLRVALRQIDGVVIADSRRRQQQGCDHAELEDGVESHRHANSPRPAAEEYR